METLAEAKTLLKRHKKELTIKYKIKNIGIFGSFVRGEARKNSDVDILVEFSEPVTFFDFLDLEESLESILGRKVDLVSQKALKPFIGKQILAEVVYL